MTTSTTTTTTKNADGTSTEQTVVHEAEAWYEKESAAFHDTLQNWVSHFQGLSTGAGWLGIAYAAFSFAKHLL